MKVIFCAECGHKLSEGAKFCPFCGAKIDRSVEEGSHIVSEEKKEEGRFFKTLLNSAKNKEKEESLEAKKETSNVKAVDVATVAATPTLSKDKEEIEKENWEDPSVGMCIISCFFPIIGFIAALANLGSNKKKAGKYGMWGAIGFFLGFILRMASL